MGIPTVEFVAGQMWNQIRLDISNLLVPINVESFSELHDFVDANWYGGFCSDDEGNITDTLIDHFGGRDEHEGMPQGVVDFINDCQNMVDTWIKRGDLTTYVDWTVARPFTPQAYGTLLKGYKRLSRALDRIASAGTRESTCVDDLRAIAREAVNGGKLLT